MLTELDDAVVITNAADVGCQTDGIRLSDSLNNTGHSSSESDSNQFNLNQTHSFSLKLMMAAIWNSAICGF